MQCKQKWMQLYNQDPENSVWSPHELQSLFALYQKYSSQWSMIHKSIPTKNKIQIRNKFYGTIRNLIRFLLQYFKMGAQQTTSISNRIKPQLLQKIYNSQQQFSFCAGIVKKAIHDMGFTLDKEKFQAQILSNQQLYLKVIQVLYQNEKKHKFKNFLHQNLQIKGRQVPKFTNEKALPKKDSLPTTVEMKEQRSEFSVNNAQLNGNNRKHQEKELAFPTEFYCYTQPIIWIYSFPSI